MRISSILRRDFPRGWWRSSAWWFAGFRDVMVSCMVAMFTAAYMGRARRIVRHRDDPQEVARLVGRVEGWMMAVLLGAAYLSMLVALVVQLGQPSGPLWIVGATMFLWSTSSIAIGGAVLVVLARSRLRQRRAWSDIDFVEENTPRHGRPPETVEEYRALRMKRESGSDGA